MATDTIRCGLCGEHLIDHEDAILVVERETHTEHLHVGCAEPLVGDDRPELEAALVAQGHWAPA
jgi:hypothetical protein